MNKATIVITSLMALTLSSSCMKKPELEDDHGPVVPVASIQQALIEAWGNADPTSIKVNEFSYMEKEQAIEDLPAKLVGQEGMTVAKKETTASEIKYTVIRQINEIVNGQSKLSTKEETITIPNTTIQSVKTMALGVQTMQSLLMACIPEEGWNVTCHNLKVKNEVVPAPELVSKQEGCQGLPDCKMNLKHVSFDLVVVGQNEDGSSRQDKVNYQVTVSPDAPYLSRLMTFCYRGVVTVAPAGNQYLVKICDKVKNFQRGQN